MSATLIAKELSAGHGEQLLFSGLDLVVAPGDVIGLVGANGAGKSTLLRILAGLEPPEHGVVQVRPSTATVGYLASLLLSRYDIVLLDEPTNDLDLDGLRRLEEFVAALPAGTVVISHDREFLTRSVNQVLELDIAQQQVRHYGGGYASIPGGARSDPSARPVAAGHPRPPHTRSGTDQPPHHS